MLFCVTFKAYWNACRALEAPSNVELRELITFILRTRCACGCGWARARLRPCIRGPRTAGLPAIGGRNARLAPAGRRPGEFRRPGRLPGGASPGWTAAQREGCRETTPDNHAPRGTG